MRLSGIEKVEVHYSGGGDSGSIENIEVHSKTLSKDGRLLLENDFLNDKTVANLKEVNEALGTLRCWVVLERADAVVGDLAYVAADRSGLRIIDVSNPAVPVEVGSFTVFLRSVETVTVAGNFAYVTTEEDISLRIVDVSNPEAPVEVGSLSFPVPPDRFVPV